MAKKSMVAREKKRMRTVAKYADKRKQLKAILANAQAPSEEKHSAQLALQNLPRNASPIRLRNRCAITGRPRGYYRKFGLGRNKLREFAMRGEVPGIVKASW